MGSFSGKSTAEEVIKKLNISLVGKNIIITGASSGIGLECARVMINAGGNVFLANRNIEKSTPLIEELRQECGDPTRVHLLQLDLSDLSSCRAAAATFCSLNIPLHILLNNGGVMCIQNKQLSKDGFEMQMATNHFGHFVFTQELLEPLKAAGTSRVVNLSSRAHYRCSIRFDDMDFNSDYDPWKAYGQSKTANILFTKELQKRYGQDGITSVAVHPGVIASELWRHTPNPMTPNKTIPQGASTSIYCCVSPDIEGGLYYDNCHIADVAPYAQDMEAATRLWDISIERTKIAL